MKIAFYTLGCKVNQYETQALEQLAVRRGHTLVPFEGEADAYVINTCTVTAVSDKKSRHVIRRARKTAPDGIIAVCGCYPQTHPEDVGRLGVDLIAGTGDRTGFVELLERTWQERQPITALDNAFHRRSFEALPAGGLEGRTRAMLKIEDGCVNFCSYCIIPYARGAVRSLPVEQAAAQARDLAEAGYRELVLTGIELSAYGRDLPERPGLAALIAQVCRAVPGMRVRLGSLEPRTVTEDFCAQLAGLPNLCPHFHLSLQSGCDATLARMKRRYTTERYLESVELLRRHFDRPALTTDLIVGFPGETEGEFAQTLSFLQTCAFAQMHIFPYSRRQGTPAAGMPGQIPNGEKARRAHQGAELARAMEKSWLSSWMGQRVSVLFEEEKDGFWRGYTPQYIEVRGKGENLHNRVCPVTLTAVGEGVAFGVVTEEEAP